MARSDGRTVVQSWCSECALSPRAGAAPVELSGPGGFPGLLFGRCANCSWEFVATQGGPVSARPLRYVYNPGDELRFYFVYPFEGGKVLGPSFHCAPGVWELEGPNGNATEENRPGEGDPNQGQLEQAPERDDDQHGELQ